MASSTDFDPAREISTSARTTSSALRHQISQNSSVDALMLAHQHPPEQPTPNNDIYSKSDARVIQGWRERRPRATNQLVYSGTVGPKYSFGSPGLLRTGPIDSGSGGGGGNYTRRRGELERAETLSGDMTGQQPECPVCLEAYCENEPARIPRSLHCGHGVCTGEIRTRTLCRFG